MSNKRSNRKRFRPKRAKLKQPLENSEVISLLHGGSLELSSLIKGVGPYFDYIRSFIRRPLTYVQRINYKDKYVFRNACVFMCYSIVLNYILLLPVFVYHGHGIHRVTFYSRTIIQGGIAVLGLHLGFRVLGGTGTWRQTFSGALFSFGFLMPLSAILFLPAYFALGTDFMFGDPISSELISNTPLFWWAYFLLVGQIYGLVGFIHVGKFAKVIHGIGWMKVMGAYLIWAVTALPLLWVINPFLSDVFKYLEQALAFIT